MKAAAIIPARIGSTRFARKALALLDGTAIINHVWQAAQASAIFDIVIVATDSQEILETVTKAGGEARLTRIDHLSGSDRVAEVAAALDADLIVNIQGDEPFITGSALKPLLDVFSDPTVQMASLMTPLAQPKMQDDPNVVKVVCANTGDALYFSRAQIPFQRDTENTHIPMRHIGVYAWRQACLMRFVALKPGILEQVEKLEQLRALENGIPIRMVQTAYQGWGIDTPQDLINAENYIRKLKEKS